jgi:hypothetical protein
MTKQTAKPDMNMSDPGIANPSWLRLSLARVQPKRVIKLGNNFWPARQPDNSSEHRVHSH